MKLLITGDLVVNRKYNATDMIDKSVVNLFSQSDYNIVNLEAPVTEGNQKIPKTGPHLKADKKNTSEALKVLKVSMVTLANNHMLDYGEDGIADTLQFCKENNIITVGAGMNIQEASQTRHINSNEGKIAIINFAENEWASATQDYAGSNPMDIIDNANQIKAARKCADYVIVIIHGGYEHFNLPSPSIKKRYRFYAEQGADIIIAHHTHCFSGFEIYNNIPIFYSLGNFLFTEECQHEDWYMGLILELVIENRELKTKLHTVELHPHSFRLELSDSKLQQERIERFNDIIKNDHELNKNWQLYVDSQSKRYLNYWSPVSFIKNRYLRAFLNRLNLNLTNKAGLALYLNLMRCEAHNEISKEILRKHLSR